MEKYLRLLSTKTTNYESIGGGSYGALTAQDVCIAISYAKLTVVQSHLVNLYALNQNTIDQIKSATKIIQSELVNANIAELNDDHEISIFIALVEICKCPGDYKPSERKRAVIGGVSRMRVQRHLNTVIDKFKAAFRNQIEIAGSKIESQIKSPVN